jgi:hypothetical protein
VYVAGRDSINVVVISPDGQRHRQLLFNRDGLVNPMVLDYDRSTDRLLVVNLLFDWFLLLFFFSRCIVCPSTYRILLPSSYL